MDDTDASDKCTEHDQLKTIFCFKTNTLICQACNGDAHQGHTHKQLVGSAPEMLFQDLDSLNATRTELKKSIEHIEQMKARMEERGADMRDKIIAAYDELKNTVEKQKGEVIKEAKKRVKKEIKLLERESESLSEKCDDIERLMQTTGNRVKHSQNQTLIDNYDQYHSKMEEELESALGVMCDDDINMDDIDFDIELEPVENLKKMCENMKVEVVHLALHPESCTIRPADTQDSANVGASCKYVVTFDEAKKPVVCGKKKFEIECSIASLADESIVSACTLRLVSQREYSVQFTPSVQGRNELVVKVNGEPVRVLNGPCIVPVSILPTQRGRVVQTIPGFTEPWDVAVYSPPLDRPEDLKVYVTDGSKIVMFDSSHRRVKELEMSNFRKEKDEFNLSKLWGIDVDNTTGNVFVTGIYYKRKLRKVTNIPYISRKRKIVMLDSKLDAKMVVKSHGKLNLRGVMVTHNTVLACDDNKSCIKVYDKDKLGKLAKAISSRDNDHKQLTNISDMSQGNDGKYLYISNFGDSSVMVFQKVASNGTTGANAGAPGANVGAPGANVGAPGANAGVPGANAGSPGANAGDGEYEYHHWFGDHEGVNMLKSPSGVCVKDDFVYIADWDNHSVSVFTAMAEGRTGGEYVCSFGKKGNGEGELFHPWGVDIDCYGFLYVCDQGNKRVQIF